MERNEFLELVSGRKGQFMALEWTSTVKPAARYAKPGEDHADLVKVSHAVTRTGIDFAAMSVNADREVGSLPWGTWNTAPWIIEHHGKLYARIYALEGSVRTAYFVNGAEVDRETFAAYLTPSARKAMLEGKHGLGGIMTVTLANLRTRETVTA